MVKRREANLFVHAARLVSRRHLGLLTVFRFEATDLTVELTRGDTSPFHDLPNGATVNVLINVDMERAKTREPVVFRAVREFERHGRRPKFGPPLPSEDR